MKVLFLTPQRPYPVHQGTTIRNFNIIAELAKRHQISLLTFLEPDQAPDHGSLTTLCDLVMTVPVPVRSTAKRLWQMITTIRPDMSWRLWSTQYRDRLIDLLKASSFDVVQIEGIEMAPYLPTVRRFAPNAKIIYDDHNAEWLLQYRNFTTDIRNPRRWIAAVYSFVQTQRLKRYERAACQQADGVIVCSEADRVALQKLDRSLEITLVPNGVNLAVFSNYQGEQINFDLVFTGKMDYRPNIDAMLWFGSHVLPLILSRRPRTTLAIVGQRPHPRLDTLRSLPAITITGFVDEIMPYIAGARVFIAPFRVGAGTRLKLLQAMAMRKAVVATTVGAEGYPVQHNQEMLLLDDPEAIAEAILVLLDDAERSAQLGERAFQFVQAQYDWQTLIPKMEALYESVLDVRAD